MLHFIRSKGCSATNNMITRLGKLIRKQRKWICMNDEAAQWLLGALLRSSLFLRFNSLPFFPSRMKFNFFFKGPYTPETPYWRVYEGFWALKLWNHECRALKKFHIYLSKLLEALKLHFWINREICSSRVSPPLTWPALDKFGHARCTLCPAALLLH